MSDFNFSIDLPVRSEWANVDLLRISVLNCFTAVFSNIDGCHTLAMVTGELLENAIKYGDWSGSEHCFRLRVWGDGARAHVSVENPVREEDASANEVIKTLRWVKEFPSAEEAYRAQLLKIAAAPRDPSASRLGLVRIAYEGNCVLRADISGRVIRVTADIEL
jgi:hypothetical protein